MRRWRRKCLTEYLDKLLLFTVTPLPVSSTTSTISVNGMRARWLASSTADLEGASKCDQRRGWSITQRTVRTHGVEVLSPHFDHYLGFFQKSSPLKHSSRSLPSNDAV